MRADDSEGSPSKRKPILGIFSTCCASTDEQSAKSMAHSARQMTFLLMSFLPFLALCSLPHALCNFSPNHLIRSPQHLLRNRETDLLRRFQVDDELEFGWLFDGEIGGLDADRKSTRLNSSHVKISYAVFCLKKKK